MDKKLDATSVDLIFADTRVKARGTNRIDFFQFEIALELLAEKKGTNKMEVRTAMIQQGVPKMAHATVPAQVLKVVRPKDNARLISEKRIAAILRRSPRELGKDTWKKEVDNKDLWKVFGLDSKAGRILKRVYTNPVQDVSPSRLSLRTPHSSQRFSSPPSRGKASLSSRGGPCRNTHTASFFPQKAPEDPGSVSGASMPIQ